MATVAKCRDLTLKGLPCRRNATKAGFCWQHYNRANRIVLVDRKSLKIKEQSPGVLAGDDSKADAKNGRKKSEDAVEVDIGGEKWKVKKGDIDLLKGLLEKLKL